MNLLPYITAFFAGAFLCNSIPHLVAGLQGQVFPTPFAKPRGVGNSSPLVNVYWGLFNGVVGLNLLTVFPVPIELNLDFGCVVLGAASLGSYLAVHFGKVRNNPR